MLLAFMHPLSDFLLSGPYSRPLSGPLDSCYPLLPYGMAIAKGSSLEAPESSSVKKPRTVFTPKQLLHLEEEFLKNQFPNMEQRRQIAKALDLTQQHIQVSKSTGHTMHASSPSHRSKLSLKKRMLSSPCP